MLLCELTDARLSSKAETGFFRKNPVSFSKKTLDSR